MALLSVALISTASVVVATIELFRRRSRALTAGDLKKAGIEDSILTTSKLSTEDRLVIKEAFMTSIEFRWMAAGGDAETHRKITYYMIECVLRFTEKYGTFLVIRDEGGKLLGALGLIAPYKRSWLKYVHFMRSVIPMGLPVPERISAESKARFQAFTGLTDRAAKKVMNDTPYYYIQALGVNTGCHGKGIGTRLLSAALKIAAETPTYLECHDGNVAFYSKRNFEKGYSDLMGDDTSNQINYNFMVHWGSAKK